LSVKLCKLPAKQHRVSVQKEQEESSTPCNHRIFYQA